MSDRLTDEQVFAIATYGGNGQATWLAREVQESRIRIAGLEAELRHFRLQAIERANPWPIPSSEKRRRAES